MSLLGLRSIGEGRPRREHLAGERSAREQALGLDEAVAPELTERDADGGQGRARVSRDRDVVEARDRDVVGDADAELGEPGEDAERQEVVGACDGRERHARRAEGVDAGGPALAIERRVDDEALVRCQARVGQPVAVPVEALARDVQRGRARKERDPLVTEPRERADHRRDPARVVHAHLGLAQRVRREMDDRGPELAHPVHVAGELLVERGVVEPAAREDHRRHAHRAEQADVLALAVGVALGAAGDDEEARGGRRVLDAPHDLGEVGVGDVVDDHADDRHLALLAARARARSARSRACVPPRGRAPGSGR